MSTSHPLATDDLLRGITMRVLSVFPKSVAVSALTSRVTEIALREGASRRTKPHRSLISAEDSG